MATMAENVIAAGSKNRPPMLEKGMYDSWKTRIMLYIQGKENGWTCLNGFNQKIVLINSIIEMYVKDLDGVKILIVTQYF
ncbi:hypothetical protein Tco_0418951 [Tanacetum coccineum]